MADDRLLNKVADFNTREKKAYPRPTVYFHFRTIIIRQMQMLNPCHT